MSLAVATQIFGKKVRRPQDMKDEIEFEYYALEQVEMRANDFIAAHNLSRDKILTYKVKMKKSRENFLRNIKGGNRIREKVEVMNVRIYLSYIYDDSEGYKFHSEPEIRGDMLQEELGTNMSPDGLS